MSAEFSRRSFLKYTALTAVAVAGSSLLTGCSGYNPVRNDVGENSINTVLKVRSTMKSAVYDAARKTAKFEIVVYNGRKSALTITPVNFKVTAPSYYAYMDDNITVRTPDSYDPQIKQGGTATFIITASNLTLAEGEKLKFTYYPDLPEYPEYSANWELDRAVLTAAGNGTSGS